MNAPPDFLLDWGKRFLPHYFTLQPSRMHRRLAERLIGLRRGSKLNLLAPRDSAKSTLANTVFGLYCAVTGREPYILLIGETQAQARDDLRKIKHELEHNAHGLHEAYPDACGVGSQWQGNSILLRNGTLIQAFGTGSKIRGRKQLATRPTMVIIDDPQSKEAIYSEVKRGRHWTWLTQDVLSIGGPETIFIMLGTALHRQGLVNRIMGKDGAGWLKMHAKAIEKWPSDMHLWKQWEEIYSHYDPNDVDCEATKRAFAFYKEHREEMDAGAVVNWPDREPIYSLMKHRVEIGRHAFESEKQGVPVNPEMCEFPEEYFDSHIWFEQWPLDSALIIKAMGVDPSKGKTDRPSDYSAIVSIGMDASGIVYIEADLARRPPPQIVQDCVAQYRMFRPQVMGFESNAWQDLLCEDVQDEFQRQRQVQYWVHPIETHGKPVRIRGLASYLSRKRFRFKKGSPGTRLLVEQLRDYPTADHDDGPDGLEIAIQAAAMVQRGAAAEASEAKDEYLEC